MLTSVHACCLSSMGVPLAEIYCGCRGRALVLRAVSHCTSSCRFGCLKTYTEATLYENFE